MRIVIVTRIFTPEPAAASFLLEATARAFAAAGHEVEVVTTTVPPGLNEDSPDGVHVRRAWVRRDSQGYVRGYSSYLSFDIPVFFRLLFSRRADIYLVEPPPTTGVMVRMVSLLRRTPYVYDAADLWSDAAAAVTSSSVVLRALLAMERFALRGAAHAFAISPGLIERMRELGIQTDATAVGFGTDTTRFKYSPLELPEESPLFVYGGSYSEWHGAEVFIEAIVRVQQRYPRARVLFVGNGSEQSRLRELAEKRGVVGSVEFRGSVPPEELSKILSAATASLASLKPGTGYDYAFTTKVYSSLVSGCPVIFAGTGPTGPFLRMQAESQPVGWAIDWDIDAVEQAMLQVAAHPLNGESRAALARWASERFSLSAVAARIVEGTEQSVAARS